MREYRLYKMTKEGGIRDAPEVFEASDDEEARRLAKELAGPGRHELWMGSTIIDDWGGS